MTDPTPQQTSFVETKFDEQAFLMYKINELARFHNTLYTTGIPEPMGVDKIGPYEKVDLLKGSSYALFSKIANSNYFKKQPILDLTPAQFSELVPQVRIFKSYRNESGKIDREVEIKFPSYLDVNDVLEPSRGGYGLVSFEIDSAGTNYYEADKLFNAKMMLFFQSFDEFFKERDGFSFVDLVVMPPFHKKDPAINQPQAEKPNNKNISPKFPELFEIKVQLGWSLGPLTKSSAFYDIPGEKRTKVIQAIQEAKMVFFLSLTNHNISVKENGTINIDISYVGRMDFISTDIRSNFLMTKEIQEVLDILSDEIRKANEEKQDLAEGSDTSAVDNRIEVLRRNLQEAKTNWSRHILSSLIEELLKPPNGGMSRILQSQISANALSQLIPHNLNSGVDSFPLSPITLTSPVVLGKDTDVQQLISFPRTEEDAANGANPEEQAAQGITKDADGNERYNINWFYVGDLFDIIAKRAFTNSEVSQGKYRSFSSKVADRIRIILTDFDIYDYETGRPIRLNLAHVPISVKKFTNFFYQKVVRTGNLEYTFNQFIKDFLNHFIKEIFLDNKHIFNGNFKQVLNFRTTLFATPAIDNEDPLRVMFNQNSNALGEPLQPTTGGEPLWSTINVGKITPENFISDVGLIKNLDEYFFYYVVNISINDPKKQTGDYEQDILNGIPHLYIGRDAGVVKNVNFNKTDIPYLREARIQTESWDPVLQLASVYNINVSMMGNMIFSPGMMLFLNPIGLGSVKMGLPQQKNSYAALMGIGGYHYVNKVSHFIQSGKFETKLEALWQSSGNGLDSKNNDTINYGYLDNATPITDEGII